MVSTTRPLLPGITAVRVALGLACLGLAALAPAAEAAGLMRLRRTDRVLPSSGDPVWALQLELPGEPLRSYAALAGRADRQQADRHRLGSRSPLPPGHYRVSEIVSLAGSDDLPVELGRISWIGLEPQFPTDRRALGIHLDPSAGHGSESGTDGCIGMIHADDLLTLTALLQQHGVSELEVLP
ncbi:L,D-transpeptidase [Synechococcus sp. CCY9201]|uniref:L,D-transpeptidase n=1 Tax=Synechococcus sp. CCY9201 TaxID=174697 RepID=UPI002B1F8E4D|nr:L,D-transpeptidase [Synechococcus sp. CCY9201]MEA5475228.1 L,D-transpeptidase [Synechococcus sp. CCY9201]